MPMPRPRPRAQQRQPAAAPDRSRVISHHLDHHQARGPGLGPKHTAFLHNYPRNAVAGLSRARARVPAQGAEGCWVVAGCQGVDQGWVCVGEGEGRLG